MHDAAAIKSNESYRNPSKMNFAIKIPTLHSTGREQLLIALITSQDLCRLKPNTSRKGSKGKAFRGYSLHVPPILIADDLQLNPGGRKGWDVCAHHQMGKAADLSVATS